ncbi:MAG: hypothetical protein O7D30_12585 [Rickettsia endosymbiont of Ixodes persulcatus]|nr:hypothetical protein [Rickettsia endosymbiont of Ixodes persulcatus]
MFVKLLRFVHTIPGALKSPKIKYLKESSVLTTTTMILIIVTIMIIMILLKMKIKININQ